MFNQVCKINDTAIKIDQVKTLMGLLIEYRDSMPRKYQDNIIHVAFDILHEQKNELIEVSTKLSGELKGNKTIQTN